MNDPSKQPAGKPSGGRRNRRGTGSAKAKRSAARLAAVQALYQIDLGGSTAEAVLADFARHSMGSDPEGPQMVPPDATLLPAIVRGTTVRRGELDAAILGALDRDAALEHVDALLRAVLRAGSYELMAQHDTHPLIIISDYVEVTRAFYAGREPAMINGVLDRLARVLRPEAFETDAGTDDAG